ncbi:MAG TPA: carboxypeptidase-like regulatory domain-containing protein, partial [Terriglobales bacterium]
MKFSSFIIVGILIALSALGAAQAPTATLRGQVTDPSGAVVTNATVAIVVNGVPAHSAATNRSGIYEIGNLAPGKYTVTANARGFSTFAQTDVEITAEQTAQLNIALEISVQKEKVNVQEETPQVDVN